MFRQSVEQSVNMLNALGQEPSEKILNRLNQALMIDSNPYSQVCL